MSHHDFIRRNASGAWPNEYVPGAQDWQRWDAAQFRSVNGDDGGVWTPTSPVVIGGNGTTMVNLSTAGSQFTGGAKTTFGGRILLGGNDFPNVSPSRSRTTTWPLWETQSNFPPTWLDNTEQFFNSNSGFGVNPGNGIVEIVIPPRFLHAGATLQSVTFRFRVPQLPSLAQMSNAHLIQTIGGTSAAGAFLSFPNAGGNFLVLWSASSSRTVGTYNRPTLAKANGFYYKVTSVSGTGTTGASEPTWPTIIGNTVTDNPGANQVVWTCIGMNGLGTNKQLTDPATLYANGSVQALTFQTDPAVSNTVDPGANFYSMFFQIGPFAIWHSIQFTFSGISSLAFE